MGGLGESRRRFCCVGLLWVVRGMAKIEGATDKVIKGRDQETDREAWWVACFMSFVYAVFDPMILHVGPWWVLFQPCNQQ